MAKPAAKSACPASATKKREAVVVRHHLATKAKDTSNNDAIAQQYRDYLAEGAGCAEAPKMRYYLAELLWATAEANTDLGATARRWEDAAVAFTDALRKGGLDRKVSQEAAYASILAWKNAIKSAPRAKVSGSLAKTARPLSRRERNMLAAFDDYERVVIDKKDKELAMLRFLRARIYWQHNQLDTAIPLLQKVVTDYPAMDVGEFAANLLLDSLNRAKRWQDFAHWVGKMQAMPKLLNGRSELARRLGTLSIQAKRKAAEGYEKSGDYTACATTYLAIHRAAPTAARGDEVLYNAAVCFERAGSTQEALSALHTLMSAYPQSPLVSRAQQRVQRLHGTRAPTVP